MQNNIVKLLYLSTMTSIPSLTVVFTVRYVKGGSVFQTIASIYYLPSVFILFPRPVNLKELDHALKYIKGKF